MRVLIACEFSGVIRDAYTRAGHDAWSCDLEPGEGEYTHRHIQDDITRVLTPLHLYPVRPGKLYSPESWDLLIAHPPCTYLANSGVRWLYGGKGKTIDQARWAQMEQARAFFLMLLNAPVYRICIENPIPHRHARLPKYSQIIQPWQFGHGETKATCLWLKNLPPLYPTDIVSGRHARVHRMAPGPERTRERSRTYPGIAAAMANQWHN